MKKEVLTGTAFVYTERGCTLSEDTLLLARFAAEKHPKRICDLGTGCGAIPLFLLGEGARYAQGVEREPEAAALARRSAQDNGLCDRFAVVTADWNDLPLPDESFDLVTCNPPYFKKGSGAASPDPARRAAREEDENGIVGVCRAAAKLLAYHGSACFCYRPERLADLLCAMREADLEPKKLRYVVNQGSTEPCLVLAEGRKGAHPGLTTEIFRKGEQA